MDQAARRSPIIGEPKDRQQRDARGVWMRQNLHTKPFDFGPWQGRPMNTVRLATIFANSKLAQT